MSTQMYGFIGLLLAGVTFFCYILQAKYKTDIAFGIAVSVVVLAAWPVLVWLLPFYLAARLTRKRIGKESLK